MIRGGHRPRNVGRGVAAFSFEPLRATDLPRLATWLSRSHVERWWREPYDITSVRRNYLPMVDGSDPTEAFIVNLSGRPMGYVQRYLIDDDPEWRATIRTVLGDSSGIGIDYLIGEPDLVGKGIGRQMISQFVRDCWKTPPISGPNRGRPAGEECGLVEGPRGGGLSTCLGRSA